MLLLGERLRGGVEFEGPIRGRAEEGFGAAGALDAPLHPARSERPRRCRKLKDPRIVI
jgi:hypothetical protein